MQCISEDLQMVLLTSQGLVGWGYGSTNKKCCGQKDRSVVWIASSAEAGVYVDLSNSSNSRKQHVMVHLDALYSVRVSEQFDDDMSAALIYAVQPGSGPSGPGVALSAAWGEDPSVSYQYQGIPWIWAQPQRCFRSRQSAMPNLWTSQQSRLAKQWNIPSVFLLWDNACRTVYCESKGYPRWWGVYAKGSTTYVSGGDVTDDLKGTPFPLDEAGFTMTADLISMTILHIAFYVTNNGKSSLASVSISNEILDSHHEACISA